VAWNSINKRPHPPNEMDTNSSSDGASDSRKISLNLLNDHDDPSRPSHKRSRSFPSFLFQSLALEESGRPTNNKAQPQRKVSPTRRRLVKRYSGNVRQHKMDSADGQGAIHDMAARRIVQNGKRSTTGVLLSLRAFDHDTTVARCTCCVSVARCIISLMTGTVMSHEWPQQ
jgi:hypothetical protein